MQPGLQDPAELGRLRERNAATAAAQVKVRIDGVTCLLNDAVLQHAASGRSHDMRPSPTRNKMFKLFAMKSRCALFAGALESIQRWRTRCCSGPVDQAAIHDEDRRGHPAEAVKRRLPLGEVSVFR